MWWGGFVLVIDSWVDGLFSKKRRNEGGNPAGFFVLVFDNCFGLCYRSLYVCRSHGFI